MKRILHISKYYFPFRGGTEVVAQDIAEGLTDFENRVLAFNHEKGNRKDYVNGIEVIRVNCFAKIASQSLSLRYYPILKKIIKGWQPDAIHFHHPNLFVASFLNLLLPKKTKLIVHWHLDIVKQKYLYMLLKGVEKRLLRRADVIIVTSNEYAESSKPLTPFMDKVKVIYNGIQTGRLEIQGGDLEKITRIKSRYDNRNIIFFIGRHVPYKGLDYLLDAEKHVRQECVFVIAGKGPMTDELKVKTNSSRVFFVDRLSEDDLRCYLHAADIFAFPSITKNEAFGLALAEGMYSLCAPVTFTIEGSGVNEVSLNGVTGIEVENRNAEKFAEALDTLLSDTELRLKYARAAKERVEQYFTVEQEQSQFTQLYKELLK